MKDVHDNKLCAICWGKIPEKDVIVDPIDNEYLHPECARKKMEDKEEGDSGCACSVDDSYCNCYGA